MPTKVTVTSSTKDHVRELLDNNKTFLGNIAHEETKTSQYYTIKTQYILWTQYYTIYMDHIDIQCYTDHFDTMLYGSF